MTTNNKTAKKKKKTPKWLPWVFAGVIFFGIIGATILALVLMVKPQQPTAVANPEETTVPTETQEIQEVKATATEWVVQEDLLQFRETDGMELVFVPEGDFIMGSNAQQLENAQPAHIVYLNAFQIDKYEVTNAQYAAFLNQAKELFTNGAAWIGSSESGLRLEEVESVWQPKTGFELHPVVSVSWFGAQAYCEWVGGRLPTEAEWEKAARGADALTYPWGNDFEECIFANSYGCAIDTKPVGNYPAGISPYGAFDMAGNVYEWVTDWYASEYSENSLHENPTGPDFGTDRVIRGGSYYTYETDLRTAFRLYSDPTSMQRYTGFRCAMEIEP